MNKLRYEYGFLVAGVAMLWGSLYFVYQWWSLLLASFATTDKLALAVTFIATPVIAVAVASLRTRLPNYGGSPPVADLLRLLAPMTLLGFISTGTALVAWAILDSREILLPFVRWSLWTGLLSCGGLAARQLSLVLLNIHEYYRLCAWDRRVHPNSY